MAAIVLALCAGVCWGIGELFTKSVLHSGQVGPITAIAVRSTVALPILWIAYTITVPVMKAEPTNWLQADTGILAKLTLGSGLIAGAIAMACFYGALHLGEISRVKPIAFATAPAVAVLLGWLILKEPMTAKKAAGIIAILAGVVLLTGK